MKKLRNWISLRIVIYIIIAGGTIGIAFGVYKYKSQPVCKNCNVIFVSLDTLSALHLPCYGYKLNTAPRLCKYASENVMFKNAFAHAPMSLPSHFSMFTSLYPNQHKITEAEKRPLDERYKTLAQVFRSNGYKTIYNGPLTDDHFPLDRGIERGFDIIEKRGNFTVTDINYWEPSIKRFKENIKNNKPTFMFLHTYSVHDPYLTGKTDHPFTDLEFSHIAVTEQDFHTLSVEYFKHCGKYSLEDTLLRAKLNDKEVALLLRLQQNNDFARSFDLYSDVSEYIKARCLSAWHTAKIDFSDKKQREYLKALYDEQILYMDKRLAVLFELLEDPEVAKKTVLVIAGDHGEEFWEHDTWGHSQNLYLTSTQVPLIMHIPGVQKKQIQSIVQGIDIYPTVLSLTGQLVQSDIQGIDLSGQIFDRKNAQYNRYVLSEWYEKTAMQIDEWRYYYGKGKKPLELYNLRDDPQEKINVVEKFPEVVKRFEKLMPY